MVETEAPRDCGGVSDGGAKRHGATCAVTVTEAARCAQDRQGRGGRIQRPRARSGLREAVPPSDEGFEALDCRGQEDRATSLSTTNDNNEGREAWSTCQRHSGRYGASRQLSRNNIVCGAPQGGFAKAGTVFSSSACSIASRCCRI